MAELQAWGPGFADCNINGIPDSIDIREGTAEDFNGNGILDACDPDTSAYHRQFSEDWKLLASASDTSYFWAAHKWPGTVLIRYTVPPSGSRVGLDLVGSDGHVVSTLVNKKQSSGAYVLDWDKMDRGKQVPPSFYTLRLKVGRRVYSRPVHWAKFAD